MLKLLTIILNMAESCEQDLDNLKIQLDTLNQRLKDIETRSDDYIKEEKRNSFFNTIINKKRKLFKEFESFVLFFYAFIIDTLKFSWRIIKWSSILMYIFAIAVILLILADVYDDIFAFIVRVVSDLLTPIDDIVEFINNDILPILRDVVDLLCKKISIGPIHIGPILDHCPDINSITVPNKNQSWFIILEELDCSNFDTAGKELLQLTRLGTGSPVCSTESFKLV